MNEKGEVTLFSVLLVFVLSSLMLLCSLELQKSYSLLKKRTSLFLCTKEIKGELSNHLKFMGQTNWGIKNLRRIALLTIFIPGLQGVSSNAEKAKKVLMLSQEVRVISYLKKLKDLRSKGCPMDPRLFITPHELALTGLERDDDGRAQLREKEWSYLFIKLPFTLEVKVTSKGLERPAPRPEITTSEKGAMLSSLFL